MEYDVVVRNGVVVDGSGAPRFKADVAIIGERSTWLM
jgi:N-acyl-D-aspartate/D-glutamate deacylase